ncbi:hypothetical protein KCU65_g385, partial [Aureobasidium melanogenum]
MEQPSNEPGVGVGLVLEGLGVRELNQEIIYRQTGGSGGRDLIVELLVACGVAALAVHYEDEGVDKGTAIRVLTGPQHAFQAGPRVFKRQLVETRLESPECGFLPGF